MAVTIKHLWWPQLGVHAHGLFISSQATRQAVQHYADGIGEEGAAAEIGHTTPTGTADGKKAPTPPLNSLRPAGRPG